MGLGKTLQAIAMIYAFLTCGPPGKPFASKAIVVSPATLTTNWTREFKRWLGTHRLGVVRISVKNTEEQEAAIRIFMASVPQNVLVISYEMFRKHAGIIASLENALLFCDEGHRLKNSDGNKTIKALSESNITRRAILTGTPLQNNLLEFFSMLDFVCPGVLGSQNEFKNTFANPITLSREAGCDPKLRMAGVSRAKELTALSSKYILRRTNEILAQFLPPKHEHVVFCQLTPTQKVVYEAIVSSKMIHHALSIKSTSLALRSITLLKQLANCPSIVYSKVASAHGQEPEDLNKDEEQCSFLASIAESFPSSFSSDIKSMEISGKMAVLLHIIDSVDQSNRRAQNLQQQERIVVVSNYQETLNQIQDHLSSNSISFVRLDGSTPSSARGDIVERFQSKNSSTLVFLLSAQAGGMGLTLTAANRLVLFDPNWNPAIDLQAMGRIWRDGQKLPCHIYRLLSAGTIDEKIFQRQIRKGDIAATILSSTSSSQESELKLTQDDLKSLFVFHPSTLCDTYENVYQRTVESSRLAHPSPSGLPLALTSASTSTFDIETAQAWGDKFNFYPQGEHCPDEMLSTSKHVSFVFSAKQLDDVQVSDKPNEIDWLTSPAFSFDEESDSAISDDESTLAPLSKRRRVLVNSDSEEDD